MEILLPDDCPHPQWCSGKRGGPHDATCPTVVLALSDAQVEAFCATYATEERNLEWGRLISATYDGRTASTSIGDAETEPDDRRWLAENLLMHAKLGTPP